MINKKAMDEYGLNIHSLITLYDIHTKNKLGKYLNNTLFKKTITFLIDNKFITEISPFNFKIRGKGLEVLEIMTSDITPTIKKDKIKKTERAILNEIDIDKYRSLWKGLKPGSMGSKQACKNKLIKWMKENPEYSFNDIINAAKTYINSVDNLRYLQNADYFIYKQDKSGINSSRLSSFIDEEFLDDEWTTSLI